MSIGMGRADIGRAEVEFSKEEILSPFPAQLRFKPCWRVHSHGSPNGQEILWAALQFAGASSSQGGGDLLPPNCQSGCYQPSWATGPEKLQLGGSGASMSPRRARGGGAPCGLEGEPLLAAVPFQCLH